ncbi:MAG: hypothetical protein JW395_3007 [Nitrospira sp.]|nr:hypothetical protein [Nitrospira sp.]
MSTEVKHDVESDCILCDAMESFIADPPDTDYQRGYLCALIWVYEEVLYDVEPLSEECAELLERTGHHIFKRRRPSPTLVSPRRLTVA